MILNRTPKYFLMYNLKLILAFHSSYFFCANGVATETTTATMAIIIIL